MEQGAAFFLLVASLSIQCPVRLQQQRIQDGRKDPASRAATSKSSSLASLVLAGRPGLDRGTKNVCIARLPRRLRASLGCRTASFFSSSVLGRPEAAFESLICPMNEFRTLIDKARRSLEYHSNDGLPAMQGLSRKERGDALIDDLVVIFNRGQARFTNAASCIKSRSLATKSWPA